MVSECRVELRRSVGGRRTFNGVWGGATSICHWCMGVELKGFVAVAFSWNWRAYEAEGYEFSGEQECRERISSLKKWKQQQQPFLVLAQTK